MMTPMARSTTLPLKANPLNSSNSDRAGLAGLRCRRSMDGSRLPGTGELLRDLAEKRRSQGQPRRQGSPGRQLDDAEAQDVGMLLHGLESRRSGDAVEVDDGDCLSALVLAADIHLGNVDSLVAQ